jgi:hypothetical protein
MLLAVLVAAAPAAARAQAIDGLAFYAGYRFSGEFDDVATGEHWQASEGASWALAVDFAIDPQRQYQLLASHRNSALGPSGFVSSVGEIGLGITYLHFGGVYYLEQVGRGAYAVGGVGLTHFNPKDSAFGSETGFSLNLGFGYAIPLGSRASFRLEGRAYATLVNSSSALFCSGGCVVQIQGETFAQGEVLAGIGVRF